MIQREEKKSIKMKNYKNEKKKIKTNLFYFQSMNSKILSRGRKFKDEKGSNFKNENLLKLLINNFNSLK